MANTLKIKRGLAASIPQGQLAEPLFTTDTYDLYIGKGAGGNQRIQNYIASGTSSQFLKGDGSLDSTTYQATSEKGQNNGYASLDAGGKIPASQLPSSVIEYKGTWNASTNTPTLADGTGDAGDVYIVSVGGTQNLGSGSITFDAGDWVMYNGSVWQKSTGSNAVASVNGQTGIVVLDTDDISEPVSATNLWFTNARARTAISLTTTGTSGAATYDNNTGVLNIPQYQAVLTNPVTGTGTNNEIAYFNTTGSTIASLSTATYPSLTELSYVKGVTSAIQTQLNAKEPTVTKGNLTETTSSVLTITGGTGAVIGSGTTIAVSQASGSTSGYLSSTDWTTFNSKQAQLNGSGFVKATGTTISYDNSTYLTTSDAASTYLPLTGGTLTGALNGTSATFSASVTTPSGFYIDANTYLYEGILRLTDLVGKKNILQLQASSSGHYITSTFLSGGSQQAIYISAKSTAGQNVIFNTDGTTTFNHGITGTTASFTSNSGNFNLGSQADTAIYAHFGSKSASGGQAVAMRLAGTLTATANFDNLFGLWVDYTDNAAGYAGVTRYGIYQNDSGKRNYFGGLTTFNSAVTGSDTITATAFIPSGTSVPSRGMYSSASNYLDFSTNGTRAITISDGQKVGIGADPISAYRLYVNGDVYASGTVYGSSASFVGTGTFGSSISATSATFSALVTINTNDALRIDPSSGSSYMQYRIGGTPYAYTGVSGLSNDIITGSALGDLNIRAGNNQKILFSTNNGGSSAMTITSGGNVGIGTTSPNSFNAGANQLVVGSGSATQGLTIYSSGDSNIYFANGTTGSSVYNGAIGYNHTSNYMFFGTNGGAERMRITSGGNLLFAGNQTIGVNTADGSDNKYLAIAAGGDSATSRGATIYLSGNERTGAEGLLSLYAGNASGGNITFHTGADAERMRITSGGNVLINRTSGWSTFGDSGGAGIISDANGSVFYAVYDGGESLGLSRRGSDGTIALFRRATTTVGTISVTSSATAYNTSSDYRLKHDLKDFNGLDIISKIKSYDFAWKLDNTRMYGVIAHELQEILGYAVIGEKDGEQMQGVDYSKLTPILVKAIQELKAELDTLKNINNN